MEEYYILYAITADPSLRLFPSIASKYPVFLHKASIGKLTPEEKEIFEELSNIKDHPHYTLCVEEDVSNQPLPERIKYETQHKKLIENYNGAFKESCSSEYTPDYVRYIEKWKCIADEIRSYRDEPQPAPPDVDAVPNENPPAVMPKDQIPSFPPLPPGDVGNGDWLTLAEFVEATEFPNDSVRQYLKRGSDELANIDGIAHSRCTAGRMNGIIWAKKPNKERANATSYYFLRETVPEKRPQKPKKQKK